MHLVFVYGTLKKGKHNNYLLRNSECLGEATTLPQFQMHDFGPYPCLIAGDKAYTGELYDVNDDTFENLDFLEGYPGFYTRDSYEVTSSTDEDDLILKAWIYTLADEKYAASLPKVNRESW